LFVVSFLSCFTLFLSGFLLVFLKLLSLRIWKASLLRLKLFLGKIPSSQIESLTDTTPLNISLPIVGLIISQKTHNNQSVLAALTKAWEFAVPFSFAVLGPNKFLFKLSKPEHSTKILKQVTWNVNGFLIILQHWHPKATLNELSFHSTSFWIQVHGLPLINMSTKIAISIGNGLRHLLQVDDSCSDKKVFLDFLWRLK
jgi:hypothetical protein